MKTNVLKNISIFFLLSFISIATFADDDNDGKKGNESTLSFDATITENKAQVNIQNISTEKGAMLRVLTSRGKVIYSESIQGKEFFNRKYDFSQLAVGKYVLSLENDANNITKHFTVGYDHVVRMYELANFANFKPVIFEKDEKFNVCFENTTHRKLNINIVDAWGNVVHQEWVEQGVKYARSFNFSRLVKGEYKIEVFCNDEYYFDKIVRNI